MPARVLRGAIFLIPNAVGYTDEPYDKDIHDPLCALGIVELYVESYRNVDHQSGAEPGANFSGQSVRGADTGVSLPTGKFSRTVVAGVGGDQECGPER